MRLRLNLCDVDVQIKISGWQGMDPDEDLGDWWGDWCNVELSFHSKYLNYSPNEEILMASEVQYLCDDLEALLDGSLPGDEHLGFVEPDMEFDLRVAKRLYDIPGHVTYRNGYKDVDVFAEWTINFWCSDGLGANSFKMGLDRNDLQNICNYLRYVIGRIGKDAPEIVDMLEKGTLLPE